MPMSMSSTTYHVRFMLLMFAMVNLRSGAGSLAPTAATAAATAARDPGGAVATFL